jgi:hypothetical protein
MAGTRPPRFATALSAWLCREALKALEKPIIFVVRADPEPDDVSAIPYAHSAVISANSHRKDRAALAHPFELQTRMARVINEQAIRLSRLFANMIRQAAVGVPEARLCE